MKKNKVEDKYKKKFIQQIVIVTVGIFLPILVIVSLKSCGQ